ncbi:hypothetical protein CRE_23577 [Caenorhabditis remanei]|uniref:Uncharacterized protein n=1 Tax=Caenorhabditis remanei TaxID=31234 RepID=E3MVW3_CAERE|nr:hypothetical protein CRE_23577 [Caenorhabditis remanei]
MAQPVPPPGVQTQRMATAAKPAVKTAAKHRMRRMEAIYPNDLVRYVPPGSQPKQPKPQRAWIRFKGRLYRLNLNE